MEDEAVAPHGYCHSVVPERETVGADEETLGLREEPDAQDEQEVDKVAHVGEEVVVADGVVLVPAYGHEIAAKVVSNVLHLESLELLTLFARYTSSRSTAAIHQ